MKTESPMDIRVIHFNTHKYGKCPACGKRARRQRVFIKSVNLDTESILAERSVLERRAVAWAKTPTYHAKCELTKKE